MILMSNLLEFLSPYKKLDIHLVLLNFVGFSIVLSWLQLLLMIPLKYPLGIIAALFTSMYILYRVSDEKKDVALFIFLLIIYSLIGNYMVDFSWDGMAYHQEAILQLANGWNPIWDAPLMDDVNNSIWINSYPKALWIFGAAVSGLTGCLEMGKMVYYILIVSNIMTLHAIFGRTGTLLACQKIWISIIVLNPVVLTQMFTYYNDAIIYLLILQIVSLTYCYSHHNIYSHESSKILCLTLFFCFVILCNTKFTGLVYACFLVICICIYSFLNSNKKLGSSFVKLMAIYILSGLIFGMNPYMTNTLEHQHPFWPLMGNDTIDIISPHEHPEFLQQNRVTKLFWANLATARSKIFENEKTAQELGNPKLKIPFVVSIDELRCYALMDTRIGGFGPWFNVLLYFALFFGCWSLYKKSLSKNEIFFILALLVGTVINPECWWARYVPFFYLFPVAILLFYCCREKNRIIQLAFMFVLMGNILMVGMVTFVYQIKLNVDFYRDIAFVESIYDQTKEPINIDFGPFKSAREKLHHRGIPYVEHDSGINTEWENSKKMKGIGEVFWEKNN